jgi:hypothetical protein
MTEPGWRIAVPSAWLAAGLNVAHPGAEGPVCSRGLTLAGATTSTPTAFVDADTYLGLGDHCPELGATTGLPKAIDGLIINIKPIAGWPRGTPVCRQQNGVQACIVEGIPDADIVYVWVHAAGESHPMLLEIGLAGSGTTARTVLDSLRAIGCPPNAPCKA